jgi:hypothetical protein
MPDVFSLFTPQLDDSGHHLASVLTATATVAIPAVELVAPNAAQGEACEVVVVFRPCSQRPYYEDVLHVEVPNQQEKLSIPVKVRDCVGMAAGHCHNA